jgi:hypothetical protein
MFTAHFNTSFQIPEIPVIRKDKGSYSKREFIKAFKSLVLCLVVEVFPLLLHP